ncbi:tRNA (cytosine(32)/uridine(32)-2'-O)-methyltransferase TrmJ [Rodentibacter pneumotropicus]|uniref:tRNA (cytosine(32)/uridine(32)-2'-O)-methyltransferase TrmJ n=1 Tax=Rodentibacter pneumotropicus TaxID=758 RepID=UPI000361B237|nr:tRNA (cytosine(32)/uridine(32)-2'-O)-methyltransferase TrmJ [Rodentibacter pneumotropicus]NBH74519.1 tRNA (cytosine(32)/uridine(32)-2'-O)-methyltransferase TrmJ [Rodentibacter pneumotropicus]OOF62597.1 tRNA (cytosine(32)/uridine(32)-2'-O)-methyltransferase TrmJ [Rodentibacter pneumotropicus]THA04453.1 tRNA (cytosine(32)/uridine(32)-2'-O)-methyltransferase TrmJ [Rodentibacter pneumotropicus]THA05014.1 tRNA (cytosine(32)/uridine(32)-2'-O)-methyltransferase TrmJ [Rodentibacter pneumotropicus]T
MFDRIRIVLIETSHSGNIGSSARAMKTMGLSQLCLVSPKVVDEQSIALAAGAADIVKNAKIVSSFDEAVADCSLVIGTSARLRHLQSTLIEPRECAEKVAKHHGKVAIVFGRERVGLHNDELIKCHYHLTIPANPDYSSLNLAMAVQLVSYELYMANSIKNCNAAQTFSEKAIARQSVTVQEMEYFFNHTDRLYQSLGFIHNQGVMQKLRRLYNRANIEKNELNILRGMLSAVEKRLDLPKIDS